MSLLTDIKYGFLSTASNFAIQRNQEVTSEHLDTLRDERTASANTRAKEMHRVASVPVAVVEKWLSEGFDIYKESAKAIVARLHAEDLSAFVATSKRL